MASDSSNGATIYPRFGTDGVRGLANEVLTPDVAVALGRAAAETLGGRRVVIGRDTRRSGHMIEAGLVAGYTAAGVDVELLGVVPTPAVAWASLGDDVSGAMISASHNPFGDNGIKLFAPGGAKLGDVVEQQIQQRFHELLAGAVTPGPTGADIGVVLDGSGDAAVSGWVELITNSVAAGALAGQRLVLDCANGAASGWAEQIFRAIGADVTVIGAEPDGVNINEASGSTHPEALQAATVEAGAAAGLAFDGDADRLIAVDHTGAIVDGDRILSILASDWKATGRLTDDTVVVTVMSNLGFHRAMAAADITVATTGVGDRYVLEELSRGGYSLGGEQSGHVICRDLAGTGDGILAAVQLMDAVVRSGATLADLSASAMTTVPQVLKNVRLAVRDPEIIDKMAPDVEAASAAMGDDGRVLVRASGTEPLVRVMVEHVDATEAVRVCDELCDRARSLMAPETT